MPDEFVTPCINKDYLTLPFTLRMRAVRFAGYSWVKKWQTEIKRNLDVWRNR